MAPFTSFNLNFDDSHALEDSKYENDNEADWSNVFQYSHIHRSLTELARERNLVHYDAGLRYISDDNAGEKRDYRHHYAVGDKVKEIKNGEFSEYEKLVPRTVAKAGKGSEQKAQSERYDAADLAV